MSAVDDLALKVVRLKDELKTATEKWHRAILERSPVKVGDVVETAEEWRGNVERGKVKSVYVNQSGDIRISAAKQTKRGWHSTATIYERNPKRLKVVEASCQTP